MPTPVLTRCKLKRQRNNNNWNPLPSRLSNFRKNTRRTNGVWKFRLTWMSSLRPSSASKRRESLTEWWWTTALWLFLTVRISRVWISRCLYRISRLKALPSRIASYSLTSGIKWLESFAPCFMISATIQRLSRNSKRMSSSSKITARHRLKIFPMEKIRKRLKLS